VASRADRRFVITGVVEEQKTGRPLRDLIVRAYDEDLVFDDLVGYATTDDDGRFEIRFGTEKFRDMIESRPDLYLRIFDASGVFLIHDTTAAVRRYATENEHFQIAISARALDPRNFQR
jgi:hypothetical protein